MEWWKERTYSDLCECAHTRTHTYTSQSTPICMHVCTKFKKKMFLKISNQNSKAEGCSIALGSVGFVVIVSWVLTFYNVHFLIFAPSTKISPLDSHTSTKVSSVGQELKVLIPTL